MNEGRNIRYHVISDSVEEMPEAASDEFTFHHKEFLTFLEKGDIPLKNHHTQFTVISDSIEEIDEDVEEVHLNRDDFMRKLR